MIRLIFDGHSAARLIRCFVISLLTCTTAHATRGMSAPSDLDDVTIAGHVADSNGAALPGALVTATLITTKVARTVVADAEGRYYFVELSPGTYDVRAAYTGFAVEEKAGLSTVAGQNVRLDFVLRPAGVVAEAVVIAEAAAAPRVDTARTVVGGTLTRGEIESLPLPSRAPLDFVFMLGGVTEEPFSLRDVAEDRDSRAPSNRERTNTTPEEAGTFALAGGASFSNNITIDGLDDNDDRAARERFQPPLEAVEEVQVIANQFSAEYGRASGGRINVRTRSGADELRGRLFYFFRDEALDANTYNNNRRGLKRLPFQQHNPGFTLGGPVLFRSRRAVRRDRHRAGRTHFFAACEFDTTLASTLVDALVPVERNARFGLPPPTSLAGRRREQSATAPNEPAELAPFIERVSTPSRNLLLTARFDHQFNDTHNGAFLLQYGRLRNLRQFGGGLRLADSLQGQARRSEALSYSDNYVFSARVVNQLRAQASRLRPAVRVRGAGTSPVVLITIKDPLDEANSTDRSGTLVAGSSDSGASERREARFQIQDSLTVLRGRHAVKLGGDAQRLRSSFTDLTDANGTYSFTSAGDFLANAPSRFRQRFNAASTQTNLYTGFFVQDEWRPLTGLTVSYGLRYENETVLRDRNNFAPRAALAYDPFGTGKTVLRFGAGLFFNRTLLRTIDDFTLGRELIEFDTNMLPASARRPFIAANLRFPETLASDSALVRQFGTRVVDFTRRLDPELRVPESYQANLGVERELSGGLVVEANYTFNRGLHLWREFNANAPVLPRGFKNFTAYLLSRDFPNFRDADGTRPVFNSRTAGELVRFTTVSAVDGDADAIGRVLEFGVPVSIFNLNSVGSTTTLNAALSALRDLRPDPSRRQIEQLASVGNSFYHGLTVELRRRFARRAEGGTTSLAFSCRAAYTLSRLTDDGVVNTSDALVVGDFRAERARSLLDRRHRFVFSGMLDMPRLFGRLRFAPVVRLASGAPFNVTLGGVDRNLDDVANDRPAFSGDRQAIRARHPHEPPDARLLAAFALPTIGQSGNLPRNAGAGPALFAFDLNITREWRLTEKARLRPVVEIDNVLNKTVFTFGAEFINFNALRAGATTGAQQASLDTFLVPERTRRPRTVRLGLRFDF